MFVVYYIWVPFRAIGEYQRRYKIQEETKLLKRVEDLKQNFISLMSHDLKTPVAKIAGVADNMLQKNRGGETYVHEGLKTIIDSTKELNNFITSILDLTKVESRNISLNLQSKDVNKVIDDCVFSSDTVAESTDFTDQDTAEGGTNADAFGTDTFPAGVTIYGRWTAVDLTSGAVMLYMGS